MAANFPSLRREPERPNNRLDAGSLNMRFLPYAQSASLPNIIVDGAANDGTILTLSHWPRSNTPSELKRDTSAEIAFAYLDSPQFHLDADVVSNNHFDEDGLVGVFTILQPLAADRHRQALVDVAHAGDFGVFVTRDAARIAFALSACADEELSPLPKSIFRLRYPAMAGELYIHLLELLPELVANLGSYRSLWETEDQKLAASEELIEKGLITIEERPESDLAVVRVTADLTAATVHRFTQRHLAECHPGAIHTRTPCSRIFLVQGNRVEFQYRYESWVQMVSRRPQPRVDLAGVAEQLNREEQTAGRWVFDGVDQITPRLHHEGSPETSISPDRTLKLIEDCLLTGPPAWNPY
jgi:hypothetical protein